MARLSEIRRLLEESSDAASALSDLTEFTTIVTLGTTASGGVLTIPLIIAESGKHMTVAQLLKRAKTLPKKQRERLVRAILALEKPLRESAASGRRLARVTWPDIEARAKLIVGDRVLPNLVLLERGEDAY